MLVMTDDNLASKLSVISKQKWIHIVIYYINWTEINVLMLITVQFKSFLTVCISKDACDIESSIGTAAIIYCVTPAFLSCYVRDCVPSSLPSTVKIPIWFVQLNFHWGPFQGIKGVGQTSEDAADVATEMVVVVNQNQLVIDICREI